MPTTSLNLISFFIRLTKASTSPRRRPRSSAGATRPCASYARPVAPYPREIAERVVASGIATGGLTPERTVSYELTTHPELFERVSKGIYHLRPEPYNDGGDNIWLFQARPEQYDE